MRLIITEQDRQKILDKYRDNTDQTLLNKLKRRYTIIPKHTKETFFGPYEVDTSIVYDDGDKVAEIKTHKNELVNKIYNEVIESIYSGESLDRDKIGIIRRTIKRYLDEAPFIEPIK